MGNIDQATVLRRENIVWIITIFFAIFGIIANNLELEDLKEQTNKRRKFYRTINLTLLIIAMFIYLYFINLAINNLKNAVTTRAKLIFVATISFFFGGALLLIAELINVQE